MRRLIALVLLALVLTGPITACPDMGGPSSFWPGSIHGEGPLHLPKEAVQEAIFDNCFLAGTNVETASRGGVAVEDVRVGDRIAPPPGHEGCTDPRCGEVVRLFPGQTDQVVSITAITRPRAREHRSAARDGGEAGEEDAEPPSAEATQTIHCTPGHPFFVEGKGWVFAADLRDGDAFEARGVPVVVAAIEVKAERAQTFNFETRCHHTYRVSGQAGQPTVLVHNMSLKRIKVRASGHHVPAVRKARGRPFQMSRGNKSWPTLFPRGKDAAHTHWRLHDAERAFVGERRGAFPGTDKELFAAYRRAYRGLGDIRVDVRSPNRTHLLAQNVTPRQAVTVMENWLKKQGLLD